MSKYYILNFLVFVSFIGYCQTDSIDQRLLTITKVYGVVKYYNNEKDDEHLDKKFLKLIHDVSKLTYNNKSFNLDINNLFNGDEKTLKTDIQQQKPFSQFSKTDHIVTIDFSWIRQNLLLTEENKRLFEQLINSHKKVSNTNIGHKRIYIHNEHIGLESISQNEEYILGLMKFWNVMNYFFPYKKLMNKNWDEVLKDEISEFHLIDSYNKYDALIKRLSATLGDSHVHIEDKNRDDYDVWKLPLRIVIAEEQMIIKSVDNSLSKLYDIKTGDIIEMLDGKNYNSLWQEYSQQVSFSTHQAGIQFFSVYLWHKFNYCDSIVVADINSNGIIHQESLKTIKLDDFRKYVPWKESVGSYKIIEEHIGYIKYDNMSYSNLGKAIRSLRNKEYLILDCRGYNSSIANLRLIHFMGNSKIHFAKNYKPNLEYPGVFYKPKLINANIPNVTSTYKGIVIVLIDEQAVSAMESVLMAIEIRREDAVFIGSPTQGADGEQSLVILPDGVKIFFSGNNYQYPDGRQLQRIGILPDIHVERTIESIKKDEDNVLNRAIDYIDSLNSN